MPFGIDQARRVCIITMIFYPMWDRCSEIYILFFSVVTLLFFLFPTHIRAGITGEVTSQILGARTNEPLIGANVIVDGTHDGAATGQTGCYVLLNIPRAPIRYFFRYSF